MKNECNKGNYLIYIEIILFVIVLYNVECKYCITDY